MNAILALIVAVGLVLSIIGSWTAMRSTPIVGGDAQGYLAIDGDADMEKLLRRQRQGWRLLLGGFVMQFIGAAGYAYLALR